MADKKSGPSWKLLLLILGVLVVFAWATARDGDDSVEPVASDTSTPSAQVASQQSAQTAPQTFGDLSYRDPTAGEYVSVGRLLVKRGCGEYYVSQLDRGEYAVKCTRDGSTWHYWMVWDRIEEVMGPYDTGDRVP